MSDEEKAPGSTEKDKVDGNRRRLLRRIAMASVTGYAAPAFTGLAVARADDDDDDDDDDDRGGRGGGGRREDRDDDRRPRTPTRRAQPSRPARTVNRPRRPPPEIVMAMPASLPLDGIEAAGYRILSQRISTRFGQRFLRLGLPRARTVAQAREELQRLLPDAVIDRNTLYQPDDFLCDGSCDSHEMIGWSGWPSALAPRIGMIDTGVNVDHDAFAGRNLTVHQVELADRSAAGRRHGTAIAALLVGRADSRTPGLMPMAELIAVEAFHQSAVGEAADAYSLAEAVEILIDAGVSVINMSFSGPNNAVLRDLTREAHDLGILLVAAAGNGGPGAKPAFPAAWAHVVAVTAVDSRERIYRQANQGPYIAFAAPGVGVWTAASISGGRLKSGTSYAVPFVTAVLAAERVRRPTESRQETLDRMIGCARDLGEAGFDPVYGHGLIMQADQCVAGDEQLFSVSGE